MHPALYLLALGLSSTPALTGPPSRPQHSPEGPPHGGIPSDTNSDVSICDTYSTSVLGSASPKNQHLLMTLFVNTALVGNYTTPNTGVAVNGIMWPGEWKDEAVDLMPWFNGALASSNPCPEDCGQGVSVNWLDSGGPDALRRNRTSDAVGTNQFYFVTHLTQYFGYLLSCSSFGTSYQRYNGSTNMYHIHKYMSYNNAQESYTNQQFFLSALSLGFSQRHAHQIWGMLFGLFSQRCEKPNSIPRWAEPTPQSICIDYDCPLAMDAACELYDAPVGPILVNGMAEDGDDLGS
ncbi:hypothetical protein N0V91_009275 [Didymella pomorum]|uniref:Uncharacterized protein n=1 Tax=Didymella pomorum TaxID=749634 RepID=A0A9W9D350_9PLEO|nr:hypothetical protein N0V91_009275 [Didymella pomorum]